MKKKFGISVAFLFLLSSLVEARTSYSGPSIGYLFFTILYNYPGIDDYFLDIPLHDLAGFIHRLYSYALTETDNELPWFIVSRNEAEFMDLMMANFQGLLDLLIDFHTAFRMPPLE